MKKYQVLISQKYLRSRMVNLIAVVAVMLGVAALIIVSSVMDGFARDLQDRIRGIMSHIVVESDQLVGIGDYERVIARVEKVPQVAACAPLVECPFVLIRSGDHTRFGQLRGIDLERERKTSEIEDHLKRVALEDADPKKATLATRLLKKRNYDLKFDDGTEPESDAPGVLVGVVLGARLATPVGERLTVTSPTTVMTFESQDFTVVGGFKCGHYEYDDRLMYTSLRAAQDLLGLHERVTSISVRLHDIDEAEEAKAAVAKAIRNETALANPADADDASRIETVSGDWSAVEDDDRTWLRVAPSGTNRAAFARIILNDLAPVLKKADGPTTIALAVRHAPSVDGPAPSFELCLIDSAGRRFYQDAENRELYPSAEDVHIFAADLVNYVSADGLDFLDPADIRRAEITVFGRALDFADIRFVDNRPVAVSTWFDKQHHLLRAVDVERNIQAIIMLLMVVIAGFSILAILWMMVKEKTHDIGILMSLGATRGGIVLIFLLNGVMVGSVGAGLGLAIGWTCSIYLNTIEVWLSDLFGFKLFPESIYYLDKLPHKESPGKFIIFAVAALAVSLVAAVWPAIKASRLNPIEALRYE